MNVDATQANSSTTVVHFLLDGREMEGLAGQSIAAALLANGIRRLRTTKRSGDPRGLFCGIGQCYDCLVTVDDIAFQRACLVPICEGMRIETGP